MVVVLAVVAVFVGIAIVVYIMSAEVGCMGRGGPLGRLLRNIPLRSVKIIIVAWQILTQVRANNKCTGGAEGSVCAQERVRCPMYRCVLESTA